MTTDDGHSFDYKAGWVIEPEQPPASSAAKVPYEDFGAAPLNPRRYFDPAFARLEEERLWPKVWTMAGFVSDIPQVGDYFKYDLGRESFIIVRTAPDVIKAYYNVCAHRGNALIKTDFGNLTRFFCGFHGWQFDLDGNNIQITDREMFRAETFQRGTHLTSVRCEIACGMVFINMDPQAQSLAEFLGPLVTHLKSYRIEDMHVVADAETIWDGNWKTGLDAFNEAYHAYFVHPMARGSFDDYHTQIDTYPNGMNRRIGMIGAPSPRHPQQGLNPDLQYLLTEVGLNPAEFDPNRGDVRKAIQQAKRKLAAKKGLDWSCFTDGQLTDDWNYSMFPNTTLNIHVEGLLFQRFRPHPTDPEKFIYDNMVLVHPTDNAASIPAYMGVPPDSDVSGKTRPARKYVPPGELGMGPVVDEDGKNMFFVQRGLRSRGFRGMLLGEPERCIRQFHAELDRYLYGANKPADAL
ncbi:MAG: aromatic ring-hydroxylating dioxygenase subunit alpha [Steroidobacteraceae bacterium]